ncbi:MAG: FAD-binding oxidoreductase [Pseudorhodobacter sp.]|nr:FAD-binding oxidoreductase [Pseudorhodobacter sp.]
MLGAARAEVCVIGGGYIGLSAALHLAELGLGVVLLEAFEPGWGASGRNGGQIIAGFKAERTQLLERFGEERGKRLSDWSARFVTDTLDLIKRHNIACEASQPGWLQPAHSTKSLADYQRRVTERLDFGVAARLLDREETAAMLGTEWYFGAYYDPNGGRLHPLNYARGLARAAQGRGARILGESPVEVVRREGAGWRVETAKGHVLADQVLICTNAYTDAGRQLVPNLHRSIVPLPSYMIATAPLSDDLRRAILPGGETAADLKKLTHHFRLEPDGRFLFGGRGDLNRTEDPRSINNVRGMLATIFPQLASQTLDYRWSGKVAVTTDGSPHLHRPAPGLWAVLGCNGRGVGYGTSMGKVMAGLMAGHSPEESPVPVSPIRSIAFHAFHLAGAKAAIWWKHQADLRARRKTMTELGL